jgi:hypothetical protein
MQEVTEDATNEICLRIMRNDSAWLKQHLADKLRGLKHGQAYQIIRNTPLSFFRSIDEAGETTTMLIKELVNCNADISEIVDEDTMMCWALDRKLHCLRDILLRFGADINVSEGPTTLPIALKGHDLHGSVASLAFLYKNGLRVTQKQYGEFQKLATSSLQRRDFMRMVLLVHIATETSRLDCPWFPSLIHCSLTSVKTPESASLMEALAITFVRLVHKGHVTFRGASTKLAALLFKRAANLGWEQLMCALIQWRPHLLQARWIRENKIPQELAKKADFVQWMLAYRTQPLSLQQLCKLAIRDNSGYGMTEEQIEKLYGILPRRIVNELKDVTEFTPWEGVQKWKDISELCPTEETQQ